MVQRLLIAGMLSGLLVALVAFGFARLYSETTVERAITIEEANASLDDHGHDEIVSRGTQRNLGLLTGIAFYCVALGGFLAIGAAGMYGRSGLRARTNVWVLSAVGYIAVVLVPALKYPANPPGIGSADTIGSRTELYFLLLLSSAICMAISIASSYRLARRMPAIAATPLGTAIFALTVSIPLALLPAVSEVPADFPRDLLLEFRMHAAVLQLIIWGGLGLALGWATDFIMARDRLRPAPNSDFLNG